MAEYGNQMAMPAGVASGDMSLCQYHIVRNIAAASVFLASSRGAVDTVGVLQNAPRVGEFCNVAMLGPSKVVAGSSMAVNDLFTVNGSGRAITATIPASGSRGDTILGRVLEAPGGDGDIVSCVVFAVGGTTTLL